MVSASEASLRLLVPGKRDSENSDTVAEGKGGEIAEEVVGERVEMLVLFKLAKSQVRSRLPRQFPALALETNGMWITEELVT